MQEKQKLLSAYFTLILQDHQLVYAIQQLLYFYAFRSIDFCQALTKMFYCFDLLERLSD